LFRIIIKSVAGFYQQKEAVVILLQWMDICLRAVAAWLFAFVAFFAMIVGFLAAINWLFRHSKRQKSAR
jgi:cbb3-type cytochrome oxidase subunit 3